LMTLKYIWRSFSLGCHFHVHFSYPWHAFASHGLPAIAELLVLFLLLLSQTNTLLCPFQNLQKQGIHLMLLITVDNSQEVMRISYTCRGFCDPQEEGCWEGGTAPPIFFYLWVSKCVFWCILWPSWVLNCFRAVRPRVGYAMMIMGEAMAPWPHLRIR